MQDVLTRSEAPASQIVEPQSQSQSTRFTVSEPFALDLAEVRADPLVMASVSSQNSLVKSFKDQGQVTPIVVDANNRLVDGYRRLAAAKSAGLPHLQAVRLLSGEAELARLHFNSQRKGMPPIEVCRLLAKAKRDHKIDDKQLGIIVGRSRNAVNQMVKVGQDVHRLRGEFGEKLSRVALRDLIRVVQSGRVEGRREQIIVQILANSSGSRRNVRKQSPVQAIEAASLAMQKAKCSLELINSDELEAELEGSDRFFRRYRDLLGELKDFGEAWQALTQQLRKICPEDVASISDANL